MVGGAAAAWSDASPGLAIGVGGRPLLRRVLYGLGWLSWATVGVNAGIGEPQVVGLGRVGAERHASMEPVVEDAGDRARVARQLGLALDDGCHRDDLVRGQVQAGRGRSQTDLAGLVVEGADHLLEHVDLGLTLLHLVGRGEQQALEVVDPGGLVGAAHLSARAAARNRAADRCSCGRAPDGGGDLADGEALGDDRACR